MGVVGGGVRQQNNRGCLLLSQRKSLLFSFFLAKVKEKLVLVGLDGISSEVVLSRTKIWKAKDEFAAGGRKTKGICFYSFGKIQSQLLGNKQQINCPERIPQKRE